MSRKRLIRAYKGNARNYEVVCIINQTLSLDDVKKKVEELKAIAQQEGATINNATNTSLKSYAYPIENRNNKKGYYSCLYITLEPSKLKETVRKFSMQDDVLRVFSILADPRKQHQGIFASNYEEDSYKIKKKVISYDDPNTLFKFLGERGRIEPRKQATGKKIAKGIAARQRVISKAIKRSRFLSLLPYLEE